MLAEVAERWGNATMWEGGAEVSGVVEWMKLQFKSWQAGEVSGGNSRVGAR
jgi:hypothetical protein